MSTRRRRRVAVVTGTRAEYGPLRSAMTAIRRHPRLELQLVVTGMHLLEKFGHTIDEIEADGWRIDAKVPMQTGRYSYPVRRSDWSSTSSSPSIRIGAER